jgi:hypothetical protein
MANVWDVGDNYLYNMLGAFLVQSSGQSWHVHLYQNDFDPVPGTSLDDFDEADYTDYEPIAIDPANFLGALAVTAHVAIAPYNVALSFLAGSSGFSTQNIYGYFVTDDSDNYYYCERFAVTQTIVPNATLLLTPELRHGVSLV